VSRGPGKLQRLLWQILLDQGRPMKFAEIRGRPWVRQSRERSVRRALQGMVNHGIVIVTGSGGRGDPRHYSMNALVARTRAAARRKSAAVVASRSHRT
jgi:hypothetical protein